MYCKLSDAKLKTGENLEIGVVIAPDIEHKDGIPKVLNHKGEPWLRHVNRALTGEIKELETRFYIGKIDGNIVGNIMTVEYNRTGILGHVFTVPEQRRKHICSLIMEQQMKDFKSRGGILLLGTGYNSPPYWIYHSFGFRSIIEGSGFMRFSTEEDFESKHFRIGEVKSTEVQWKHWPLMNVLTSVYGIETLRSLTFGIYGISNFEGGFLHFMKRLENENIKAKLLESEFGAVVGCITLDNDHRWTHKTYVIDIFMHNNFINHYVDLLGSLELPEGKIMCYIDEKSPSEKIDALKQFGFEKEATIKNQFIWKNEWHNVFIYSRFA